MTFVTLQIAGGAEKSLADWNISECSYHWQNQLEENVTTNAFYPADSTDLLPYGTQITLRIGRISPISSYTPAGLPIPGNTTWSGGQIIFIGWRARNRRKGSAASESMSYKFEGIWEYIFEKTTMKQLWFSYNGTANAADWRADFVLGLSLNALIGPQDTVTGSAATNLMSLAQVVKQICAYALAQGTNLLGAAPFQTDTLAYDGEGNYQLTNTYPSCDFPSGTAIQIPDYMASAYAASGHTSYSAANNTISGAAGFANVPTTELHTVLRAPLDTVKNISCAEAMRKTLRYLGTLGEAAVWFDYSTSPPTLMTSTRDQLPSISLPYGPIGYIGPMPGPNGNPIAGFTATEIERRDDLIPSAFGIDFCVSGTWAGVPYTQVVHDIAGVVEGHFLEGIGLAGSFYDGQDFATGSPVLLDTEYGSGVSLDLQEAANLPTAASTTIQMQGDSMSLTSCTISTIAVNTADPSGGGTAAAFWNALFPEFANLSASPTLFGGSTSAAGLSLTNAATGAAIDIATFQYLLLDASIAPWMLNGNLPGGAPAAAVQANITCRFTITENSLVGSTALQTGHKPYVEKTCKRTLTTIPAGFYQTQTSYTPGEAVPYGLAGFMFLIGQVPHYDGTVTLQETEVTAQIPPGHNLNLSQPVMPTILSAAAQGGRAEWTDMNAMVQSIEYNLTAGQTVVTFGPAKHLGAQDLVDRLRWNRQPRSFYSIGGNVANEPNGQSGTQLGNNVAQHAPSPGVDMHDLQFHPLNLSDATTNQSSYTRGFPGTTIDNRTGGQPIYGNESGLTNLNLPVFFQAGGSGGALGDWIRITPADISGLGGARFRQVDLYQCVSGVITHYTASVLMTKPVVVT